MTITIYEGYTKDYVILKSNNEDFKKKFGEQLNVYCNTRMYKVLSEFSSWVNNELGEECLFEIG